MKILMMTNTYTPHVSGVAKSVKSFVVEFRKAGHDVLVVAPEFEGQDPDEQDVVRVPAIQNFNGSDLSVRLPIPGFVGPHIEEFGPDVVHSNHPFLMGDTALRVANVYNKPIVFTHHTRYEEYTHYVPGDSEAFKRFVVSLSTGYANLCDYVIAPSESVADLLRERGVETPIAVIPTGIPLEEYAEGNGAGFRERLGIPEKTLVVGHLGRLAPEKNIQFLVEAVVEFLKSRPDAHFLVVGSGNSVDSIQETLAREGMSERLHMPGALRGQELVDAYHAMDVFAFASKSETQGMVLAEAMAAGVPVVALDAPGSREVVRDGHNGRLLAEEEPAAFASAIDDVISRLSGERDQVFRETQETAEKFALPRTAAKLLEVYQAVIAQGPHSREWEESVWTQAMGFLKAEWDIIKNVAQSAGDALSKESKEA